MWVIELATLSVTGCCYTVLIVVDVQNTMICHSERNLFVWDKAALTQQVARLHRQLNIVQSSWATPTGPGNMVGGCLLSQLLAV